MNWYLITYEDWPAYNQYTAKKEPFDGKDPREAVEKAKESCKGSFKLIDIKLIQTGERV